MELLLLDAAETSIVDIANVWKNSSVIYSHVDRDVARLIPFYLQENVVQR